MIYLVAVLIALGTLAYLGYPLLRRDRSYAPDQMDVRVQELASEKETLVQAIKDLEFDLASGKLSPEDYTALRGKYETRAVEVLQQLDLEEATAKERDRTAVPLQPSILAPLRAPRSVWSRPVFTTAVVGGLILITAGGGFLLGRVSRDGSAGGMIREESPERGDEAVATLESRLTQNPRDVNALVGLGRIYLQTGQMPKAIEVYKRALEVDGRNVSALSGMAMILAQAGHNEQALTLFDQALAINPQFPMALLFKGRILYEDKRDFAGAIASWERFLALVPQGEPAEVVRGWIADARRQARETTGDEKPNKTP